jgi:hypothetical protein
MSWPFDTVVFVYHSRYFATVDLSLDVGFQVSRFPKTWKRVKTSRNPEIILSFFADVSDTD